MLRADYAIGPSSRGISMRPTRITTDSHPRECESFPDLLRTDDCSCEHVSFRSGMMSKRCLLENRQRQSISIAAHHFDIILLDGRPSANDFSAIPFDRFDLCTFAVANVPNSYLERDSSGPRVLELLIDVASGAYTITLMLRSADKYSKLLCTGVKGVKCYTSRRIFYVIFSPCVHRTHYLISLSRCFARELFHTRCSLASLARSVRATVVNRSKPDDTETRKGHNLQLPSYRVNRARPSRPTSV